MLKWLLRILVILLALIIVSLAYFYIVTYDRNPGFVVDLTIDNNPEGTLSAGFAALSITPEIPDTWTDANGDAQYKPEDGDTFTDGNGNGHFDPIYIAGFQNQRPAQGVHDELWARAMIIGDGSSKIAIVVLDAIGFGADDAIAVREAIPADLGISYAFVTSTHSHETPDLLGLWGESEFKTGLNKAYQKFVQEQATAAIIKAAQKLRPAKLRFARDMDGAKDLVEDSRKPIVMDSGIRLIQAIDLETDTTLGVFYNWANHPETLWNENLLLSSDFPHFLREGMEKGIYDQDSLVTSGLGGITLFANGAIGGLMTTSPEFPIPDLFKDTSYTTPSYDKAAAQGYRLAQLGLETLADSNEIIELQQSAIRLRAKTFELPMDNPLYRLASLLTLIDRGYSSWLKIRSEVCYWELGPISFLHYPGELYPEILNGGVEKPQGQDFEIEVIEAPALRPMMAGEIKFSIGLSNDMIGYIIPKSEWDDKAPFIYEYEESPYGEINSLGPETAPIIYQELKQVINDLKK